MADSLRSLLRTRLEKLREEMQPEAGFDRRAYGYDGDGGQGDEADTTFDDVAHEDESPWRRTGERAEASDPPAAAASAGDPESPWRRGPSPGPSGAEAGDSGPSRLRGGGPHGKDTSSPSAGKPPSGSSSVRTDEARRRATPPAGPPRPSSGTSRARQLRARLQHPESLREVFLLREVIDRPVALRGRNREPRRR